MHVDISAKVPFWVPGLRGKKIEKNDANKTEEQ
jgi:hypothetical protein